MSSYQYKDHYVKDKTVLSLKWESPYMGKMVFILRQGPGFMLDRSKSAGKYIDVIKYPW